METELSSEVTGTILADSANASLRKNCKSV